MLSAWCKLWRSPNRKSRKDCCYLLVHQAWRIRHFLCPHAVIFFSSVSSWLPELTCQTRDGKGQLAQIGPRYLFPLYDKSQLDSSPHLTFKSRASGYIHICYSVPDCIIINFSIDSAMLMIPEETVVGIPANAGRIFPHGTYGIILNQWPGFRML